MRAFMFFENTLHSIMESKLVTSPDRDTVEEWLSESKLRNACLSLYTRCEVMYDGRASSELATGDRFVLCKPDGSFIVHSETGCDPQNWMPPGATISINDETPTTVSVRRTDPVELIQVTCDTIHHMSLMPMDDNAELDLKGSEADLQEYIYENPELIEPGFRAIEKEKETDAGPVDIWGNDEHGTPAVLELKRRQCGPGDVDQLRRYLDHIDADVRGILVAPSFSDRALNMLDTHDLEHREIEPPEAGREEHYSLSDF